MPKGGARVLRNLDLFGPTRDAFASTLTSLDDRMEALRTFHKAGTFSWVSLEPTLDIDVKRAAAKWPLRVQAHVLLLIRLLLV